jgi:photosystem II stability/assembly factor-like uncharacterized protein
LCHSFLLTIRPLTMKKIAFLSAFFLCFVWLSYGQTNNTPVTGKSTGFDIPDHIRSRKAYKRAEWFYIQRTVPYDTFPLYGYANEKKREIDKAKSNRSDGDAYPYWSSVGPKGIQTTIENWGTISGRVKAIAVHPTDPLTVYIGAASGGLWKTTDGGATWLDIGHGLEAQTFGAIAIDPANPEIVYAGSGEYSSMPIFFYYSGNGLYKSTNGGQNWSLITDGFGSVTFFSDLEVSPYNSNVVIASLGGGNVITGAALPNEGIWKSVNGGITWDRTLDVQEACDIAFHPTNSNIVYAAAGGFESPLSGFYISTDQGNTWTQSNTGLLLPALGGRMQFDVSRSDPNIIYAVIYEYTYNFFNMLTKAYKSVDGGGSWAHISAGTPLGGYYDSWVDQGFYDLCIAVDPVNPDHVLIGNVELHRTTNGSNFSPVRPFGSNATGSLVHQDYHKLVFAPSDPNILYIGCDGGIYKSPDKGYTASSLNLGLETLQFYRITSHPTNSGIIIGGMQDNGTARTTDGGDNWYFIFGADGQECFFDHANPNVLFSAIQWGDLYKSSNGGNTFMHMTSLAGAWTTPIFMHPTTPNVLFAANKNIVKSVNGGGSFNIIAADASPEMISAMAQSQVNPNNMIFGTGTDIFGLDTLFIVKISTDEGVTWMDVTGNIPGESRWISRVVTDPVDENAMYVLRTGFSPGNKVWKTTDLGLTWANISGDLPDLPVNDLFIDPENTDHLYLANDIGVYLSVNGGESWNFASEGIPYVPCIDFDYMKIGTTPYLRVGTYGRSIYEARLDIGVGIESLVTGQQSAVSCYPNPFNSVTTFDYKLEETGVVTLKIFNCLGQEVGIPVYEHQLKGRHQARWNAQGMPAGIYFYRLTAGNQSSKGKMMMLK